MLSVFRNKVNFAGSSRSDCIALVEAFRVSPAPKAATAGVRTLSRPVPVFVRRIFSVTDP